MLRCVIVKWLEAGIELSGKALRWVIVKWLEAGIEGVGNRQGRDSGLSGKALRWVIV